METLAQKLARRLDALWFDWVQLACTCDAPFDPEPRAHASDCYVRLALNQRRADERIIRQSMKR